MVNSRQTKQQKSQSYIIHLKFPRRRQNCLKTSQSVCIWCKCQAKQLNKLNNFTGEKWTLAQVLKDKIENLCNNFPTCLVYKKASPRRYLTILHHWPIDLKNAWS